MKTLICTTLSAFYNAMQGPARLYAYLKHKNFNVSFLDMNQNAYFSLLSEPFLGNTFDKLTSFIDPATRSRSFRENIASILINSSSGAILSLLPDGEHLKSDPGNTLYSLMDNRDAVLSAIEEARTNLDIHYLSLEPDIFLSHLYTLSCGKAIIDAAHFPVQMDFGFGFHGAGYAQNVKGLLNATNDERHNFLLPYFQREILPIIEKEQPGLIGISITHSSEFIPAFTFSRIIKSRFNDIHICMGGATVTEMAYKIVKNKNLWDFFDSMILGPGEYAFSCLVEAIENRKPLSSVPNLIYRDSDSIKESTVSHELDLNDCLTPEFVSLRPRMPLSLEISSGCYWGKCIFCYYPKMGINDLKTEYDNKKRTRSLDLAIEDIDTLEKKYNPLFLTITDSSLHPVMIEKITEGLKKNGNAIKFTSFIRFEKEFKSVKFCKKIAENGFLGGQVGLESGSQRVNDIIRKGVDVNDAKIILRNFHETGILIHVYAIVGVPGEEEQDAVKTYEFIKDHRKYLSLDWQIYTFYLLENAPTAKRIKEFGLTAEPLPDDILIQLMDYKTKTGLSQEKAAKLVMAYESKLSCYRNELSKIMDIESYKTFLIAKKVKRDENRS